MEMFTLKRSASAWVACCRACGHEQTLPMISDDDNQLDVSVKCERCPSEEACFAVPDAPAQTTNAEVV